MQTTSGGNSGDSGKKKRAVSRSGSITRDKRTGRVRLRFRRQKTEVALGNDKSRWFSNPEDAERAKDVIAGANAGVGVTLRELIVVRLESMTFADSAADTCRSVIFRAPFIDRPAHLIEQWDIQQWANALPSIPATRSVLKDGKRTRVALDRPISRAYGKQALSFVRTTFEWAKKQHRHITVNPADEVTIERATHKKGQKRRTQDFAPHPDCMKAFFCTACEAATGMRCDDVELLCACPHMPYFYRVAHAVNMMQGLRQGELASMRWERVVWSRRIDWTGNLWWVESSWEGETKTGAFRQQALIPMAARLLHRWWVAKGSPQEGLLFSKADEPPKQPLGELAIFVARHPEHTNRDVVAEAKRQGVALTLRRVETLRSEARKRAEQKRVQTTKMFAEGYDFAWTDTHYRDADGVLRVRAGWMTKLGFSVRVRFHDQRDTAATHLLSGTWGDAWTIEMVSDFIGHSDVSITRKRYAHVTSEAKTTAAAGIDPSRRIASPTPQVIASDGRVMAVDSQTSPSANIEKTRAPETGLEPVTTRLTVGHVSQDFEHLAQKPAITRPSPDHTRALDLARKVAATLAGGGPLAFGDAWALVGAVLDIDQPLVQGAAEGEASVSTEPYLRVVK